MKVTREELERCQVLLTVEVDPKKEQDLLQKAAKRIARELKIPGFRPGKAPYNVVVRRFGLEAIQQDALETSADNLIQKALEEADVIPYAQMDLESIDWNPLTLKVKVPTKPTVELTNYRDIRLDAEAVTVSEEDVEAALKDLQERNADWIPVERSSQLHDLVSIAVVEKDGDEVLAEQEEVEYELLPVEEEVEIETEAEPEMDEDDESEEDETDESPSKPFRPDLTTPLLGLSAGDEKSFTVTYPEDFNDVNYAGKDITFEVEVLAVKEKKLDPIDDDFAELVSDFATLDELKADIKEEIRQQRENEQRQELGNETVEKVINESDIEWPVALENERVEQELEAYERQVSTYGFTLESYLRLENKSRDEFTEEIRERVVNRLKRNLVIGKIAEQEKLEVSETEVLNHAKFLADISGQGDRLWRDILSSQTQQTLIANDLLVNKVIKRLGAIAKGEDPKIGDEMDESEPVPSEAIEAAAEPEAEASLENQDTIEPVDAGENRTEEPTPAELKS